MKIWNKVRYPLLVVLITAILFAVRVLSQTWTGMMYFLLIPILLSDEIFRSYWILPDILIGLTLAVCIICIPASGKLTKTRRFFLRPVLAVALLFAVSTPVISYVKEQREILEDRQYQEMVDASHQEIRDFIEIADEAIWYSKNNYGRETEFPALVREIWAGNHMPHITDTILIDYDSKTVGFAYHYISYFVLKSIPLSDQFTAPEVCNYTNTAILAEPGAKLTMYFNYKDGKQYNGYDIVCITLTMADGTVYGTTDLTDPETGRNYFLSLPTTDEVFVRIEDFLERKNND